MKDHTTMITTHTLLAAAFALALGVAPAVAGEGRGNPFDGAAFTGQTTGVGSGQLDANLGAEQPYDPSGLPGTGLTLSAEFLPVNGQNGVVQSVNSAPPGFADGTVRSAQARTVQAWHAAQLRRATLMVAQPSSIAPQS